MAHPTMGDAEEADAEAVFSVNEKAIVLVRTITCSDEFDERRHIIAKMSKKAAAVVQPRRKPRNDTRATPSRQPQRRTASNTSTAAHNINTQQQQHTPATTRFNTDTTHQ